MDQIIEFAGGMFGTRAIEIAACLLGFVNVSLIIRRTIWNYPFGIAMVILYAWIFWDYRLYAEAGLQVYFLIIQIFGWVWWLRGMGGDGRVIVVRAPMGELVGCAVVVVAVVVGLGTALAQWTDAALPYQDSTVAALSVVAQYLLARRRLESWPVWIAVDLLAIGIYIEKDLVPTAFLYALFLCLAATGFWTWARAWRRGEAVT